MTAVNTSFHCAALNIGAAVAHTAIFGIAAVGVAAHYSAVHGQYVALDHGAPLGIAAGCFAPDQGVSAYVQIVIRSYSAVTPGVPAIGPVPHITAADSAFRLNTQDIICGSFLGTASHSTMVHRSLADTGCVARSAFFAPAAV